jgi:UDP-N-acetylenolpyruvoylglucosamine reductase
MQTLQRYLREAGVDNVLVDEPLAPYTTWKIGGPADLLIVPENRQQLVETMRILHRERVPWFLLGRGSNTLVSDKGVRGAVIKLGQAFEDVRFDGETVTAGGAFSLIRLCVLAGKHGLTGLEFAGGIPGSVGGAVYMNAGAHGSDVSRILTSAEVVLETGELVRMQAGELQFRYRYSALQDRPGIVTEATFRLKYGDRKEIAAMMATYKDRRLKTQPLQMDCAGSVFRNPENHYAAKLIEEAGLKGTRCGGAVVSELHANFIVNTGNATASDVLALIKQIRTTVHDRFGILLETEVLFVGEP